MKHLEVDGIGNVSRIGLGTWQFGSREWGYGDRYASGAARDIVARARALGVTLFDTSEVYGLGKSERILGEALGDERAEVVVASKIMPVAPFPAVVKQRERASARRLQLDRIPLYQIHQPNPVVPDSVIMPGMREPSTPAGSERPASPTTRWRAGRKRTPHSGAPSSATRCISRWRIPVRSMTWFLRRTGEPHHHRLQPTGAGAAGRQIRCGQPAGRCSGRQPTVRHGEPAPDRAAAADASRRRH